MVVLPFLAQKLIGCSSHAPHYKFGKLVTQLESGQIRSLSLGQRLNVANAALSEGTSELPLPPPTPERVSGRELPRPLRRPGFGSAE